MMVRLEHHEQNMFWGASTLVLLVAIQSTVHNTLREDLLSVIIMAYPQLGLMWLLNLPVNYSGDSKLKSNYTYLTILQVRFFSISRHIS